MYNCWYFSDERTEVDERRLGSENEYSAGDDYDDDVGDYDDEDGDELSANATIFQIVQRLVEQGKTCIARNQKISRLPLLFL